MTPERPREPTAPAKPASGGRDDTHPPQPPHGSGTDTDCGREFEHAGERWVARRAGRGAAGTGSYGLGLVEAVHFWKVGEQGERPLREALLAHGRFESLYDEELGALLDRSVPVAPRP